MFDVQAAASHLEETLHSDDLTDVRACPMSVNETLKHCCLRFAPLFYFVTMKERKEGSATAYHLLRWCTR